MTRANSWTSEEEAWLREAYPTHHNATLSEMHAERFPDRPRRGPKAISSRAKVLKLRKADGFQRNPPKLWTHERAEWFKSFVPGHTEGEISTEHERLYGFPLSESQIGNAKTKLGVRSGTFGGRFEKGQRAWNKGKTWDEFMSPESQEASRRTCFKKGQVSGIAKERMKPVGYERVDAKDGYVWVKVKDTPQAQVPGSYNDNFRPKHHVVWEEANGTPVPPHTMIVFADRDKRNFDPDNLVAVPRSLWSIISRQGWAYRDRESLDACVALAKLNRKVYEARLHPRNCKRCGAEFKPRYPHQRTCDGCLGH